MSVLLLWILHALLGTTIFSLLLIWAVHSGQFKDQDRARFLPLERPDPERRDAEE